MTTYEPSEREIDAILSMRPLSDTSYASVQRALDAAKRTLVVEPDDAHVTAFAAQLAATASASALAVAAPGVRASAPTPWRRRAAAAMAIAALSVMGVAGAAAANDAAPGDLLYGLDQALERVGINDGGTGERLREAQALVERGEVERGLDYAVKSLGDDGQHEAARALERAGADGLQGAGNENVAAFLEWMVEQDRGPGFGADVAAQAKALGWGSQASTDSKPVDSATQGNAPVEPGTQGNAPVEPGTQGNAPVDPATQGNAPVDPATQGGKPADPIAQGNKPVDPGAQGGKPADPIAQGNKPVDPGAQGGEPGGRP